MYEKEAIRGIASWLTGFPLSSLSENNSNKNKGEPFKALDV
jgi:hypothetical protein